MSSLLSSAKNIASVKAGDKSKDYTEVLLNIKTTGEGEDTEIIQISFMLEGSQRGIYDEYFLPKNGLSFKAMGRNKITPEMLEGKQSVDEPSIALDKLTALNNDNNIIIIHSANYDLNVLKKANFENKMKVVDTLHVSKHLLKEAESYFLSTLFFEYGLYKKLGSVEKSLNENYNVSLKRLGTHNSLYDVVELKLLFDHLLNKAGSIGKLIELTKTPVYITDPLTFGKHRGKTPEEIYVSDESYLTWMLDNADNLDWNLKYTFQTLLDKKTNKNKTTKG